MNRRILIFFFLIAPGLSGFSQSSERFIKKYYPEPNLNALCTGVASTDYGYMLAGLVQETGGYYTYCLTGLDENGEELWQKKYGNANRSYLPHYDPDAVGMGALSKGDGFYYAVVLTHEAADSLFSTLFTFNEQGDTLWTKTLRGDEDHALLYANCVRLLPNGNFGVVGTVENSDWVPGGEIAKKSLSFLTILDSAGNPLWKKKYDYYQGGEWARVVILSMTYDPITKRYILVGYRPHSKESPYPYSSYLLYLDEEGNILSQWHPFPWSSYCDVKMLHNGNIAAGGYFSCDTDDEAKFFNNALISTFTIDGTSLHHGFFFPITGDKLTRSRFHQIEVLEGDTIVAVGMADTLLDANLKGRNNMFFFYKIADQSQMVWRRLIDIDPQVHDHGTAMTLTADGGFALAGTCFNNENSPMVLVKTDYRGCVSEECSNWLVDFEADQTTIRAGEKVTFTNLSLGATNYNWSFDGGDPPSAHTSNTSNQTVVYPYPGTYSVSLTATRETDSETKHEDNCITVLPLDPVADFAVDETGIQVGGSVRFINRSQNAASYSWYFEGGDPETSSLKEPAVTYRETGSFDVRLTAANSMGEDEMFKENYIVVDPVGIHDPEDAPPSFTIFPNPAQNQVTFGYPLGKGAAAVEIYDLAGQLIDCVTMTGNRQTYNVEHLTNSVYFAALKVDGKIVATQKMVLLN